MATKTMFNGMSRALIAGPTNMPKLKSTAAANDHDFTTADDKRSP
jgi:hypothetical protein